MKLLLLLALTTGLLSAPEPAAADAALCKSIRYVQTVVSHYGEDFDSIPKDVEVRFVEHGTYIADGFEDAKTGEIVLNIIIAMAAPIKALRDSNPDADTIMMAIDFAEIIEENCGSITNNYLKL